MKTKNIIYWAVTALLAVLCTMGSFLDIAHKPDAIALIRHLR